MSFVPLSQGVTDIFLEPVSVSGLDFDVSSNLAEKGNLPDIVVHGLVTPSDVDKLFKMYAYLQINCSFADHYRCVAVTFLR